MPSIEEAGPAPRTIEGADTVVAFVGSTPRGPQAAARIESVRDFEAAFGPRGEGADLGAAVALYFENGGGPVWIAPSLAALDAAGVEADLLALPGEDDPGALAAAVAWAEAHQALVILEPPRSVTTPPAALTWLNGAEALRSRNAAAYFPRLVTSAAATPVGNAGAVVGVIARVERARGVWKAPAGAEAVLLGVKRLAVALSDSQQQALGGEGLNALRVMPGGALVVWGARTLSPTADQWKYVPVRRMATYLERSLQRGLRWVVFEPNGPQLWAMVRQSVELFIYGLFRAGAFAGNEPQRGYFVKCDSETVSRSDIDEGRLHVVVGFAPLRPAEFVILQISLRTGDGGA